MKKILKTIITALIVIGLLNFMPDMHIENLELGLVVALGLVAVRFTFKSIVFMSDLPLNPISLGFMLMVFNMLYVLMLGLLVDGIFVSGITAAIGFSLMLSFLQFVFFSFLREANP